MTAAHYHCPRECEHPQAFVHPDGRRLCGCCWFEHMEVTEVVLCTPVVCPDLVQR